jgi:PKD repeat protein
MTIRDLHRKITRRKKRGLLSFICLFGLIYFFSLGPFSTAIADTSPPTVPEFPEVRYLSSNSALIVWSISTDDTAVSAYRVFRNNIQIATVPFSHQGGETKYLDRSLSPSSGYTYKIDAVDAAGNISGAASVTANTPSSPDKTPPSVTITSPSGGSTVGSSMSVTANASDNVRVEAVEFRLYSPTSKLVLSNRDTSSPYTTTFSTSGLTSGTYTIKAIATDSADYWEYNTVFNTFIRFENGNVSAATPVSVNVGGGGVLPPPTLTFTASPTSITSGNSSTLTWSSTNATGCTNNFSGAGLSGTKVVSPTTNTTYSITCNGLGGNITKTATVTVSAAPPPPPAPTVTLTASPTSIISGQSSTLTWSSSNATSCTNNFSGTGTSGTKVVSPTASKTYTVTCTGSGGSTTKNINVMVTGTTPPPPPPTAILSASPTSITSGQSSTLTWSSTNATSCTNNFSGSGTSGTKVISPTLSATYTLTCTGAGGSVTSNATISVSQPAKDPPPRGGGGGSSGGGNNGGGDGSNNSNRVQIQTTFGTPLNIRSGPSLTDPVISKVAVGTQGTVIGGPTSSGGLTWIQVRYDNGITGWSAQNYLVSLNTSTIPTTQVSTLTEAERQNLIKQIQQKIIELTKLLIEKIMRGEAAVYNAVLRLFSR